MRETYYVVANNTRGGWDLKNHHMEIQSHYDDLEEAVRDARRICQSEQADLHVHDEKGKVAWDEWRSQSGVELNIWREDQKLPREVEKEMAANNELKGIPKGQIQPKAKK